jgi:hypothetical protein
MHRKLIAIPAIALTAGISLAACGTSTTTKTPAAAPSSSAPVSAAPAVAPSTTPPSSAPNSGPLGTTYTVSGTDDNGSPWSYTVTCDKVDQNAVAASEFDTPSAGDHLVAVEFTITGVTGSITDDDSNNDATVYGTDSEAYTFSVDDVSDGTNFDGGDFSPAPGQTEIGWVTVEMPASVNADQVQWQDGYGSATGTWTVGS